MKKTILILAALVMLALVVRLVVAFNTYVISSDGPFYLSVAQDFSEGNYQQFLTRQTFHQLYPFLIAIASKFMANWEWAGMLVSIIISSLGVIPLYLMARKYFPDIIAVIAGLIYCFHSQGAQLSASIFTTGTHICILLFAVWVTILALETGKNYYFMLSGILAFVMYLNRPDGLVFIGIAAIGIMFLSGLSWKEKCVKAVYLIIPWLLLFPSYLFIIESATGVFGLTGKVSANVVTDMEMTRSFNGLYQFIVEFIKGANPILFVLWLVGLVIYARRKGNNFKTVSFIWTAFIGFMAVFAIYAFTHGRMSKRYTVPLFLMMLPWVSAGLYYLSGKISGSHIRKVVYSITIILLIVLSLFTFKPVAKGKLIEKNTGELLKQYHVLKSNPVNKTPVIITTLSRIGYYANGVNIMPEVWDKYDRDISARMQSIKDTARQKHADYLVLDNRITRRVPEMEVELAKYFRDDIRVELIPSLSVNGSRISYKVYRFIYTD